MLLHFRRRTQAASGEHALNEEMVGMEESYRYVSLRPFLGIFMNPVNAPNNNDQTFAFLKHQNTICEADGFSH